jgi:hypothetical protein
MGAWCQSSLLFSCLVSRCATVMSACPIIGFMFMILVLILSILWDPWCSRALVGWAALPALAVP